MNTLSPDILERISEIAEHNGYNKNNTTGFIRGVEQLMDKEFIDAFCKWLWKHGGKPFAKDKKLTEINFPSVEQSGEYGWIGANKDMLIQQFTSLQARARYNGTLGQFYTFFLERYNGTK